MCTFSSCSLPDTTAAKRSASGAELATGAGRQGRAAGRGDLDGRKAEPIDGGACDRSKGGKEQRTACGCRELSSAWRELFLFMKQLVSLLLVTPLLLFRCCLVVVCYSTSLLRRTTPENGGAGAARRQAQGDRAGKGAVLYSPRTETLERTTRHPARNSCHSRTKQGASAAAKRKNLLRGCKQSAAGALKAPLKKSGV